jgi:hypothetical protein
MSPRDHAAEAANESVIQDLRQRVADLEAQLRTARAEAAALRVARDAAVRVATWGGRRVEVQREK